MKVIYITAAEKADALAIAEKAKAPWVFIQYVETADDVKNIIQFQKKNISVKTVILVSTNYSILS